jgi:hypothetical protein
MPDITPMAPLDNRVPKPEIPDMFGRMEQMAQIRNLMNQNAIFQQTFQAKQRAGEIMATSPDVQTGLKRLQQDPLTASFAPELMNSYRQLDLTNTQVQSSQQGMYTTGFHEIMKALPSAYTDLPSFQKAMAMRIATLSPMTQQYLKDTGAVDSLQSALFDGLPQDPKAAAVQYKLRLNALLLGAGFNQESLDNIFGKPGQQDVGPGFQSTMQAPAAAGGGTTTTQGYVPKTGISPQVSTMNGVPLILGQQQAGAQAGGTDNAFGASPASASAGASAGDSAGGGVAGDGKPLIPPGTQMKSPSLSVPGAMNPTGAPLLTEQQKVIADDLAKKYGEDGLKSFQSAQTTLGMLNNMDNDMDEMLKEGGFGVPGTAAKFRIALMNAANTLQSIRGKEPAFSSKQIAAAESSMKATRTLMISSLTQMLGAQREAAQTIAGMAEAVPGIDNSYLGGKLLVDTFRSAAKRVVDEREWDNRWASANGGNLTGAAEAFNRAHPAQDYANTVFDKYGLRADGKFKSPQNVLDYVARGYLTKEQGLDILNSQFPGKGKNFKPAGAAAKPAKLLPDEDNAFGASP